MSDYYNSVSTYRSSEQTRCTLQTVYLLRDAMHQRSLCRHAVSVRPSVLLSVTFVYSAKTSNSILKIFSWSDSHTIQVFFDTERYGHISMQSPLTGASNAGEVGKNCGYRPISGFGIDNWVSVLNSFDRGVKFMTETLTTIATQQLTLFMTESVDVVFAARCCMQARPMSSCGVCLSVRLSI